MEYTYWLSAAALLSLLPSAISAYHGGDARSPLFWLFLMVALAGPLAWIIFIFGSGWRTGFAPALWVTVATTIALFAVLAARAPAARPLAAILFPYLFLLGVIATIWQNQPERVMAGAAPPAWVLLHILFSILTYSLLTLSAIAGFAAFTQDRALKNKTQGRLSRILPSLAESEAFELRLLTLCAVVLGLGLLTGMTVQYFETGSPFIASHKVILSIVTFGVVLGLLIARRLSGLRGRRAARLVLSAYLLLTLAYPGVKFITDVIIA